MRTVLDNSGHCLHPLRREAADTNEKLLSVARQAISESGPDDVSPRSIARMAGVTPGAVYRHF